MLFALFKLLFLVLLFSALLTPLVYSCLQLVWTGDLWPFSRVYDRVALFVLIVVVYFWRKKFQLDSLGQDFRLWREEDGLKKFIFGMLLTLAPVMLMIPIMVMNGDLSWKIESFSYYGVRLLKLIPTILIVSILEELIFRIFIFWLLFKSFGLWKALFASSLFYTFVHFIAPVKSFIYQKFDLLAGFEYYLVVLERILSFNLFSAAILLALIGICLASVLYHTRSLFFCAGLHAGWIAALKFTKYFTSTSNLASGPIHERYYLLTLPLTWVAVVFSFIVLIYLLQSKKIRFIFQ